MFLIVTVNVTKSPTDGKAGFQVTDVEAEVRDLRAKGVAFEEYNLPGLKTVDGIADAGGMKAAWFKDSEGNIIGLAQMTG